MRRVELLKQRHDLKIALRRAKNAVAKIEYSNEEDHVGRKLRDTLRTQLRRNLKKSTLKESLRRNIPDPCAHRGGQWYTFSDPNCYNQLDEVVVIGTQRNKKIGSEPSRKKTPSAFSTYMNNIDWWDGSLEDPWPNSKWQWFEDRQSGDQVWGSIGGGDTGRKRGKNGKVYNSYQGDDLIPSGGGTNLKYWAHKFNHLSNLLQGIRDGGELLSQSYGLYGLYKENEISNETETIKIEEHYPYYKKDRGKIIRMMNKRIFDTIIKKADKEFVKQNILERNQRSLEKAKEKYERLSGEKIY